MISPSDLSPAARRQLFNELTRRSLARFHVEGFSMLHGGEKIVPCLHIDAMAYVLEQVALGTMNRVVINLPPRHGKSELVSGSFAAWLLGHDPTLKITIVSYGAELSEPLLDKSRTIIKHPSYKRFFPKTVIKTGKDRREYFEVQGGGGVRAASKGGAMTGHGTHILIVDDFQKAGESLSAVERERAIETFRTTFVNRFDNLNDSRIIIVQQRIHEEDLSGWALRSGHWHHLCLPAIAEQDQDIPIGRGDIWHRKKGEVLAEAIASRQYLDTQLAEMGPRHFGAQFQQNPIVAEGGLVDLDWFGQYDERPERSFFHKIVQSWDPAATDRITSDYSVGQTWGFRDGAWYLLDVIRKQLAFTDLTANVLAWHRRWKADALIIEGASIGLALYDQVRVAGLPGILRSYTPRLSKLDRLANATVKLQSDTFLLPASADWLPAFRHELLAFPDGRNDDHIDALSQFVEFAFREDRWVAEGYDANGRRIRAARAPRQPRYYGGHRPSEGSW